MGGPSTMLAGRTNLLCVLACVAACGADDGRDSGGVTMTGIGSIGEAGPGSGLDGSDGGGSEDGSGTSGGDATSSPADASAGDGPKFDIGVPASESGTDGGCDTADCECTIPDHTPCD